MKPVEAARQFIQEKMPRRGVGSILAIGLLGFATLSGCAPAQNNVMIDCARGPRQATLTTTVPDGQAIDIAGTQVRVENRINLTVRTNEGTLPDRISAQPDGSLRLIHDTRLLPNSARVYDARIDGRNSDNSTKVTVSAICN